MFAGQAFAQDATAIVEDVQAGAYADGLKVNAPLYQDNRTIEAADLNTGRGFAIPGETIFPGTPGYYGEATPGHRFIPLKKLLMFDTVWDAKKAAAMLHGPTGKKDIQIRYMMVDKDTEPAHMVMCSIAMPAAVGATATEQIAIGTVAATNRKSISADVLATAIVKAADRGANYIMFMAEGVNREIDAQGFGIGFNTTQAQIYSGDNSKSNVSSGGLGYSRGWSGYIDYPWLQFTFLRVEGLADVPVVKPLPVEEDAQTGNHRAGSTQEVAEDAEPKADPIVEWFKKTFGSNAQTTTVAEISDPDTINGKPQS
jgi:hypothetical protein